MILMPFQDDPFNGDTFICQEFLRLKDQFKITYAIETGSCLYSTSKWLGENFEKVYTVEINKDFAAHGYHKVREMLNVAAAIGMDSVKYIKQTLPYIIPKEEQTIFFLDAHWNEHCPLLEELQAIADLGLKKPPIIAIHDFYTGNPELGYDSYNGQPFTWDWILPSVHKLEFAYGMEYGHYFNKEAVGAKRGIVYITPENEYYELATRISDYSQMEGIQSSK